MAWGKNDDPTTALPDANDSRDGAKPSALASTSNNKQASRPLSLLADKLNALEQSLTVVASEIGVSGMPQFKHLDPEKVYAEAVRQARQAIDQGQSNVLDRAQGASTAAAAMGVRLDSELHNLGGRLSELDARLDALLQQVAALRRQSEEQIRLPAAIDAQQQRLDMLESRLRSRQAQDEANAILQQRLDAVENHLRSRPPQDAAPVAGLQQRLDLLEAQLRSSPTPRHDDSGEWPFAAEGARIDTVPNQPTIDTASLQRDVEVTLQRRIGEALTELEARLLQRLEEQLNRMTPTPASNAVFADTAMPVVTAADIQGLHEAIATELAVMLARKAEYNEPMPLLAERNIEINPLVITAAERAIVRLTHRIEKLENQRGVDSGDQRRPPGPRLSSRSGRSLMGRLFEG